MLVLGEEYLLEKGYDTITVRSLDHSMPDREIIRLASSEQRMVITMDKDLGELVYHSEMIHCGILLLRLEDATGMEKQKVIAEILSNYAHKMKNNFCVYQNKKFRIRKLNRV